DEGPRQTGNAGYRGPSGRSLVCSQRIANAMGKYLAILDSAGFADRQNRDISDLSDRSPPFGRFGRFGRTFAALESRCPDHVDVMRWEQAIEDGKRFLAQWGSQAEALGWTAADLFGLHKPSEKPHLSYRRLSRYDCTGLCWLLDGRSVVALTGGGAV